MIVTLQADRQTLMFSATWPSEVRAFATRYQVAPVFVNIGPLEIAANVNITQHVDVLENETQKRVRLVELFGQLKVGCVYVMHDQRVCLQDGKIMVFFQTRRRVMELEKELTKAMKVLAIHGDKQQVERDRAMHGTFAPLAKLLPGRFAEFRHGKTRILLATDVVSRGLDLCDVRAVINYDYPINVEQYVHRIGRSARHERHGTSYTFLTPGDAVHVEDLIEVLQQAGQQVPESLKALKHGS